ncbi:MAG TPA: hypothetical protein DCL61_09995, partial [Cyanobacteria bacterium UBA12227]|nr:hypothetical protein [Cyanobacteria bacterium UBA12227]
MNLEQITGLTFVEIPAGTYTVGLDQNQAKLVTASERTWMIPNYIPVQSIQLPSFFISTDVVRLSHWQKLQNSPFAGALQAAITKDDLLSHQYNFIRDVRYGHKLGWYQVVKDREEINPALTLPFSKSVKFAQILGTTLPNWAQWEVSARGSQAYLFPWGDTFDLNKVKLSYLHYSYTWEDPESIMVLCRETDHIS